MDRSDEFDPSLREGESPTSRKGRAGDILGLADAVVPKSPEDPFPAHDPESAARRRERIRSGDEEGASSRTPEQTGATESKWRGGSGTDIELTRDSILATVLTIQLRVTTLHE